MTKDCDFHIPSQEEFRKGYEAYNRKERRGLVYFGALETLADYWGNAELMAVGVQRLICSWNRFYSSFDLSILTHFISENIEDLNTYKRKYIIDLSDADDERICRLFTKLLQALKRKTDGASSPVSVAKAFGLLAPNFLPIWDSSIAYQYDCMYFSDMAELPYLRFCYKMKKFSERVQSYVPHPDDRALLKRIDEYNYAKYTMGWI